MDIKDTIISNLELALIKSQYVKDPGEERPDIRDYVFAALEAQAKITWKAAKDEDIEIIRDSFNRGFEKGKKAGEQKVVGWVRIHTHKMNANMYGISLDGKEWKDFLKSEGI